MGQDPLLSFGTPTFQLSVLTSTKVLIGDLSGIKAGERIQLTGPNGGLVSILSGISPVSPIPSTGITLTEKSGADIFGIEDEGVNCVRDATDSSKIIVTAANADCYIYLKHTGKYTLVATFEGNATLNSATSSDVPVEVFQQTEISAELQYLDNGVYSTAFPGNFTTNQKAFIRAVLDGPASNFSPDDTSFPPTALADRKLLVTLNPWGAANCALDTDNLVTDLTGGVYEVTITQKSIGDPISGNFITAADFNITCSNENNLGVSFTLTFSDKTTPIKDSDDFRFLTPVSRPSIAVSPLGIGTLSASIKRNDTPVTDMLSGTTISKLHFGQRYTIGIENTSNIKAPYNYLVNYTYTYVCPLAISCFLSSVSTNTNPSVAASNARNSVLNTYNANAKWSVDPANFLSKGTNLGTGASTCGTNMVLTTQDVSNNSYSEYSQWSYLNNQSYSYWDGLNFVIVNAYQTNTSGSMTLQLKTTDAQKCALMFDSNGATNIPVTDTSGTIAIGAVSGDGLFDVTNTYAVNGIDKQAVSMTFNPATGPLNGYVQVPLSLGVTLTSTDISGGTTLPFATTFASSFSPTLDTTCAGLSQSGSIAQNGSISQTFTSTSAYALCNNFLRYLGNKYYKEVPNTAQPGMVFAKHTPTVVFTVPGSTTTITYGSSISFTVSVTGAGNGVPAPSGTVTFSRNGTTLCSNVAIANGTASCNNITNLPVGTHTITSTYNGDTNYNSASGSRTVTVNKAIPTVIFTIPASSPTSIVAGSSISFTVSVTGAGSASPSGTVTFSVGGATCTNINLVNGTASCNSITSLPTGNNTITATYSGDTNYNTENVTTTVIVTAAP
jgi:hypothetical protein